MSLDHASEELRRRYNARPGLDETEALAVFDTFRDEIEGDVRSLLERHGLPSERGHAPAPPSSPRPRTGGAAGPGG
jgi:hypothetical protein